VTQSTDWAEARAFRGSAANHLGSFFDDVSELRTRGRRPLIVRGSFNLTTNLRSPSAGRTCLSARRQHPSRRPVGSQVVAVRFEIIKKLRLLNLTVLNDIRVTEDLADFGLVGGMEAAIFLRSLSERIKPPVIPDDGSFGSPIAQAIADLLATEASVPIDGMIFASLQDTRERSFNVVLFHEAARVKGMNFPEGTEIYASTGRWTEAGWVDDYEVLENVPLLREEVGKSDQNPGWPAFAAIEKATSFDPRDPDRRDASLRIAFESIEVHRVKRVEFATDRFTVRRHLRQKGDSNDF
jgi:hypothetical protein